jgi:hypothetical protein
MGKALVIGAFVPCSTDHRSYLFVPVAMMVMMMMMAAMVAIMRDDPAAPRSIALVSKLRRAWDYLSGNY